MQFQGKLTMQTGKNGENSNFGPDFGSFDTNLGHQTICPKICLRQSLDIIVSYHYVQYQKKTNDLILRKLSEERTDRQIDGQTDRRTRVIS